MSTGLAAYRALAIFLAASQGGHQPAAISREVDPYLVLPPSLVVPRSAESRVPAAWLSVLDK
ncbi:MAG: hypothetical protein HOJ62_00215 [Planctomycetaceae bacterium]|nr:hypothetical protein [Planctomycetaceae bacterium]